MHNPQQAFEPEVRKPWKCDTSRTKGRMLRNLLTSNVDVVTTPYRTSFSPTSFNIPRASAFESLERRPGAPNAFAVSTGLMLNARPRCHHPQNTRMVANQARRETKIARPRNK